MQLTYIMQPCGMMDVLPLPFKWSIVHQKRRKKLNFKLLHRKVYKTCRNLFSVKMCREYWFCFKENKILCAFTWASGPGTELVWRFGILAYIFKKPKLAMCLAGSWRPVIFNSMNRINKKNVSDETLVFIKPCILKN